MKRFFGRTPVAGGWLVLLFWLVGGHAVGGGLLAAPFVQQFTPASGYPGQQVTITGADLAGARTVDFGGTLADFVAVSANRLVAVVPLTGFSGPIHVTAANGEGFSAASFVVAPRINGFFPNRGATNGLVTIDGANFERALQVTFNGVPARFAITAATQIQAAVPYGATNGPIAVVTAAGTTISSGSFTVTGPAPIVDDYAPTSAAPGSEIIIFGVNFTNVTAVRFGGVASPNVAVVAATQIRARVPANATTGLISVTTTGGSGTNTIPFVVTRAPVITAFDPPNGTVGTSVVILGINFNQITNVTFNGTPVSGLAVPAEGQLLVTVPPNATTGPIKVQTTQGTGTSLTNFVITTGPIITGFNPPNGQVGSVVIISGANFTRVGGAGAVKFNGKAAPYTVTADTQIHAQVPAGATTGPITITNAANQGAILGDFLVTGPGPFITSLTPANVPRGGEVSIEGVNFERVSAVKFNGVSAAFESTAATSIHAIVPPGVTTGPVTVTTPLGTSTNRIFFYASPRIASFSPATNKAGARVTVIGTNFIGATLLIGPLPVPFILESTNQAAFFVPTDAVNGYLTLTNAAGFFTTSNFLAVLPSIAAFTPAFGAPGAAVTIVGSGFTGATNVIIGGQPASFVVKGPMEISALVPTNAVPGAISVATSIGVATSTNNFITTGGSVVNLAMAGQPAVVELGEPVTYIVQVSNAGDRIVAGTVITNTLPASFTLLSTNATRGDLLVTSNTIRWSLDFLTNGTIAQLTLIARPTKSGVFTNSAQASFLQGNLVSGIKTASQRTVVISAGERTLKFVPFINGTDLLVSWPFSAAPLALEFTEDLTPPIFWSLVNNQPRNVQGRYEILLPIGPGQQYFRLRLLEQQ